MSIIFIFIALCVCVVTIISLVQHRNYWFSPIFLFACIWSVILIAYLSKLEIYYELSIHGSFLLFIGVISFLLGVTVIEISKPKIYEVPNPHFYKLKLRLFSILALLTIISYTPQAFINIGLLTQGFNFNDIYLLNLNQNREERNALLVSIQSLISGPFTFLIIPILGLELISSKKRKWIIIVSIIILILSVLQSGRRSLLIYMLPSLLFFFFNSSNSTKSFPISQRGYFILTTLFVSMVIGISWLSSQRETSLIETGYIYLGGGVTGLNHRIENIDKWYLGSGIFHGYLAPVMIAGKYLFGSYPEWWVEIDTLVEAANEIKIGPNEYMNAFTTMFYVPYLDFGLIGVIIVSFFFGILNGKVFRKIQIKPNKVNRSIYALLIIGLFGSMYTFYFTQAPYALSFLYIWIIFKEYRK